MILSQYEVYYDNTIIDKSVVWEVRGSNYTKGLSNDCIKFQWLLVKDVNEVCGLTEVCNVSVY